MSNLDKIIALTDTLIKVEENAQKERKILEFIIENTTDGYWDWNIVTGYEYMSPKFKAQLGYEPSEIKNSQDAWMALCDEEDLERAKVCIGKYLSREIDENEIDTEGFSQILKFTHKKGHIVKILCRGIIVERNEKGAPIRMVGTHVIID